MGTAEVESALVSHAKVSEAAVIGLPHELKGNTIHAFVIPRAGQTGSVELDREELACPEKLKKTQKQIPKFPGKKVDKFKEDNYNRTDEKK